jgi:hypothetical protein
MMKQKNSWEGQSHLVMKKNETLQLMVLDKGIVSDETKTKMGRDFYDLYYYI